MQVSHSILKHNQECISDSVMRSADVQKFNTILDKIPDLIQRIIAPQEHKKCNPAVAELH